MKILVVKKTTSFELYGDYVQGQVKASRLPSSELELLKKAHDEHRLSLNNLFQLLEKSKVDFDQITRDRFWPNFQNGYSREAWVNANKGDNWNWPKEIRYDAVVTVGGDGILLSASHCILDDVPLIGIKSTNSSLGQLCAYGSGNLQEFVSDLVGKKLQVTAVPRIMAKIKRLKNAEIIESEPVLNDFLFASCHPAMLVKYQLSINDSSEMQKSSGIWLATGAGSTAGIFAAGGQKTSLIDLNCQYFVRELFWANDKKAKFLRGFFQPDNTLFEIENRSECALLALDGQHGAFILDFGDKLEIRRAKPIKMAIRK